MSYQAFACRLQNVRPHSNADRIKLATVYGTQIVVGLDNVDDELGVYFPTDGQLTKVFCSENNLFRHSHLNKDREKSGYFEDNRRIKTQKFRGEESDGFWMPISCLDFMRDPTIKNGRISEGNGFDTFAGVKICQKYITKKTLKQQSQQDKEALKKNSYPFFKQHVDTKQLAYFTKEIPSGGYCILTEKLHGTSGRTSHTIIPQKPFLWLFDRPDKYKYVSGSRRVVMNFKRRSNKDYYGTNLFRKEIHDRLKDLLQKGENIFYEIVGWVNKDRPIMNIVQNKKLKDKKFAERYGDETIFNYGCNPGEYKIYVYRMNMTNPDGFIVEYSWEQIKKRCSILGLKHVPELHTFIFHKMYNDDRDNTAELLNKVNAYISSANELAAPSTLDNNHIMEGIVLRIEQGNGFSAYKHKSFQFKVLEGIIKDSNVVDMEEGS
jgi:hypothetical protein